MTLMTIEGVYENGKVELAKRPEGVDRAKVRVTFLTEASRNPKKPGGKAAALPIQVAATPIEATPAVGYSYPQALRDEYAALIHKKLHRAITTEEAARLEIVRAEINRRDSQSEAWTAWEQRAVEIDAEFAGLRRELESLPDA